MFMMNIFFGMGKARHTRIKTIFKFTTVVCIFIGFIFANRAIGSAQDRPDNSTNHEKIRERDTITIMPRSSWNAQPARPFKAHTPVLITVHHEGGKILHKTDDAKQRLKNIQTWCMGPDRNWSDIPYHYLIAPDGTVYAGRNTLTVGETNTEYDPTGHLLICFLGNYNEQKIDDHLLAVLTDLLRDSCIKYKISPKDISTHKDHSTMTSCPGEDIYAYFESGYIVDEVNKKINANRN